jgi:methylmalonyl-CoA mutase N-terminal domain/subunit
MQALADLEAGGWRPTAAAVARRAGLGKQATWQQLHSLAQAGLVTAGRRVSLTQPGRAWIERFSEAAGAGIEVDPGAAARPKTQFTTDSGIPLEPVYTPRHVDGADYEQALGEPGHYPFTRGVYPSGYRGKLWTMRQYAGYGSASETNARFRRLLAEGQTGLSVAFDLPTQIGLDPDHPLAEGEVGKVGVSIASLDDMHVLFDEIPLEDVSTSMTINTTAAILLALYVALARQRGLDIATLRGTTQNDILKEYIARGTYAYPPGPSLRLVTDVIEYCVRELPDWHPISVSGYHMREAGATADQEIAFALANGIAYVQAALARGLHVDQFAHRISFFFAVQNNLLEEVAKFRAARRIWARIMRERFGASQNRSCMLRFHAQTAGVTLTAQQPENNVVRVTIQALAAVLGGTQSLHTNSMDEALGLPSLHAARLALRTQQIIAYESGLADSIDPLGGAWALEALTTELERRANALIGQLDAMGGARQAIEKGWTQRAIQESAVTEQRRIEQNQKVVVGVNAFKTDQAHRVQPLKVAPEVRERRIQSLAALRAGRDGSLVSARLEALGQAAAGQANLMPHIIDAVEAHATLGEVCHTLRAVFGEYRPELAI